MKVTLSRNVTALASKGQAVIKLMLGYSADLIKKLQAAGTYDGMQFIAGLSRNVVLKTVKDAARSGVFGTKANWAHSDFFDQFPISSDESWAEFLLALVFDPANDREKKAIYDRLVSMNRNAGKTASSSVTTAFFGKIREELRKHNIRKRIRQGGFTEKKMDAMPDKAREHRQNKNNPWGLNVGVSAAKATKADVANPVENYQRTRKLLLRYKCVGLGFANSQDGKYLVVSFAPSKQSDLPLSGPQAIHTQIETALKSDGFKVKYKWYELTKGLFQITYLKQTTASSADRYAIKAASVPQKAHQVLLPCIVQGDAMNTDTFDTALQFLGLRDVSVEDISKFAKAIPEVKDNHPPGSYWYVVYHGTKPDDGIITDLCIDWALA